ncbi:putative polyketide synthase [Xylaria acuta]|nr:putative polyketide synthase [Xylaria acuta]
MPVAGSNGGQSDIGPDKMMPVAVVGVACRFPGDAISPGAFLDMLIKGHSAWSEVPGNRYNIDAYWHPSKERIGTTTARGGHWMKEDPALFDASVVSMTAAEAATLDPQLRMLMEVTFECLENAGMPIEGLARSDTSVFVASSSKEYPYMMFDDINNMPLHAAVGSGTTMLANRLSHFYDLRGPSITLDTACSGGLVATHFGCQSIRSGESRMSLVAASQLMLLPDSAVALSRLQFLSPSSRCYTFDDRANGYARGEGVCVMMLKSLDDALRDGDTIRAVIRGSGTNQDGKTPGIVQPNPEAQASLIRQTYEAAGLDYADTQYFEAHGTGTPVGDPLELEALVATFGITKRNTGHPLYVGSVKTSIGHLEGCAGLAGLLKTILSLENGMIMPSLNYKNPNPKLLLDDWHIKVPTKLTAWPTKGLRRASVNSFGYGGSNAHCIIDDAYNYLKSRGLHGNTATIHTPSIVGEDENAAPKLGAMPPSPDRFQGSSKRSRLFVLSSPKQAALQGLTSSYANYLDDKTSRSTPSADDSLASLAFTLGNRRSVFQWRTALVAASANDLASALSQSMKSNRANQSPEIVYVFTGQGAQWHGMGRELFQYDIFAQTVADADKYLASLGSDWSALNELNASDGQSKVNLAKFSQPLCTILQISLINLLSHWGVQPVAIVGHSSGEIAAAYATGALSAEDCWKIAYHRGRLSHEINMIAPNLKGSMLAVGLSDKDVQPYLDKLEGVVIACINSPSNVTLSGNRLTLAKLEKRFESENIFARRLKVEVAYHSPDMRVIADEYLDSIKDIRILPAKSMPVMFSTVTGTLVTPSELDASYWIRNLNSPVQFSKSFGAIFPAMSSGGRRRRHHALSARTVVEIGPHSTLQAPVRQILAKNGRTDEVDYVSVLLRGKDAVISSLEAVGHLWTKGHSLHLSRINRLEADPEPLQPLTNLPNYPWDHTNGFWHESYRTINHRFKQTPRLDLLGSPVDDFNPLEPRWRNVIRLSENPWLSDYKVQGSVLLPAASMLCAVLEAARQFADNTQNIQGFELRDVLVSRDITIPPGETGVSTVLHIRPRKVGTKASESFWYDFALYSEPRVQEIVEHCSGLLRIQYIPQTSDNEMDAEDIAECENMKEEYANYLPICKKTIKPEHFYDAWRSCGLEWGPQFQGLTKIQTMDNVACTTVAIKDTRATMPSEFEYDHLLHPTTLDTCLQAIYAPTVGSNEARVLSSIDSIYVSASQPKEPGTELCGFSTLIREGHSSFMGSTTMSDKYWLQPKIVMKGVNFARLGDPKGEAKLEKQPWEIRKICSQLVWKEDLSQISQRDAEVIFTSNPPLGAEVIAAWEKAYDIFLTRALGGLKSRESTTTTPYLARYEQWIRQRLQSVNNRTQEPGCNTISNLKFASEAEKDFLAELSKASMSGRLLYAVGEAVLGILDGGVPEHSTVEKESIFDEYCAHMLGISACNKTIAKWLDLSGHKRPNQRILQVSAGTASLTLQALEALGGQNGTTPCFSQYVFTDSDATCFGRVQEVLKAWKDRLRYSELDIEKDPADQGFENESFDVILAGHALHATKRVGVALSHCFQLLKPGGKLVLGEFTHSLDRVHFVKGFLPTWWQSEDERTSGPLLDENEWNRRLRMSKFSGIDIMTRDSQYENDYCSSMIITTKPIKPTFSFSKIVIIQASNASEYIQTLSINIFEKLTKLGLHVELATLEQATALYANGKMLISGQPVLSLLEAEIPFVYELSATNFACLKRMLIGSRGGLWVSRSNRQLDPTGDPTFCCTVGLLRCLRNEKPDIRMHELALSPGIHISSQEAADLVARSVRSIFEADSLNVEAETEMAEHNGRLYIPRVFDHKDLNKSLDMIGRRRPAELQPFYQPDRPLRLDISVPGKLDTLRFVEDPLPSDAFGENDIELEVHANGLNFVDTMVSMGLSANTELGVDASGIIKRIGSNVTTVKPGDRVATFCSGACRSLLRMHESLVAKLPKGMSLEEGASLPTVYVTAYRSLYEVGRLTSGETILIHSAAGGLGQAAIQFAKHIGAEIFATAGSIAKRQLLVNEYGIPPDHIFNSRGLSFAKGIMRMTNGKGVDVVLNSLSGEALRRTWECTSMFGRFVEVGMKNIASNASLDMSPFHRNVTFASVNMEYMLRHNRTLTARVLHKTFDFIRDRSVGLIKPTTVYKYSEMEKAFGAMQQAEHVGKIVLRADPDDLVPVIPRSPNPVSLDKNATYVIVGGLGGIGRSLVLLLVRHGAKHIAFFSRSGTAKPEAEATMDELKNLGVNATSYKCDVADPKAFEATMTRVSAEKPPVRGAIHSAMVLNDILFEAMTYEQWIETTRVKIQGAWNMHNLLPKDLDFFIMLSSASGYMGGSTLSNYASGNTYLDGLAQHRRSQGLVACALGLGFIADIGWAAENVKVSDEYRTDWDIIFIRSREVFSLVESAITGYSYDDAPMPAQVATCLGTGGELQHTKLIKTRYYFADPKYAFIRQLDVRELTAQDSSQNAVAELKSALTAATSLAQATDIIESALGAKLAMSMSMSAEDIDTSKPVSFYGVDSLISLEIRTWVSTVLKSDLGTFDILRAGPMTQLAAKIAENSMLIEEEVRGKATEQQGGLEIP